MKSTTEMIKALLFGGVVLFSAVLLAPNERLGAAARATPMHRRGKTRKARPTRVPEQVSLTVSGGNHRGRA